MDSPAQMRKSAVLLAEQHYLEENVGNPRRYFYAFKGILSKAQCLDIREQRSVEHQMQRFLEIISMDSRGFTVFVQALRAQKVHSHVANYLNKKVLEMDRLSSQGELNLLV